MGQIRRRGTIWWIRYYRNGRRHEESSHSEKWEAARDLLRTREGDIAKGIPVTAKIGQLGFEDARTDLLNDYRINGRRSTAHVARRIKLALEPYFGHRRMAAISTADVRAYAAARQKAGAANATINRELAALKRMFTLAVQSGKLGVKPYIPMLHEDNVRQGFFERHQFVAVRSKLPESLQPVVTFAYETGWRVPSEVLPLCWAQVDLKAGTVRLEPGTTKNQQARIIHMTPELRTVLETQHAEHERLKKAGRIVPYVFHRDGKRIRDFRRAWKSACTAAGCPGKLRHDFRRTAVRDIVRDAVVERVAMQLTRHKTRSVFERYNIVSEGDLEEAARKRDLARKERDGDNRGDNREVPAKQTA